MSYYKETSTHSRSIVKNSITDKGKMSTKFMVSNNKTMSYKLQHNLVPKYLVIYFLPTVHSLLILRLFCGIGVLFFGESGVFGGGVFFIFVLQKAL